VVVEAGLDYHYEGDYSAQAKGFQQHIQAARETGLPLVIHSRSADDDMAGMLEEETGQGGPFPFVLHCYTGGMELARRGLDLGGYLSFSGIVTFKNAAEIQAIAEACPADRYLVETDAPYLDSSFDPGIACGVRRWPVGSISPTSGVILGGGASWASAGVSAPQTRPRAATDRARGRGAMLGLR